MKYVAVTLLVVWYVAVAILRAKSYQQLQTKAAIKGQIQYVVTCAYIPDQVELEEEEVKPIEWFLPPHPDVLANLWKKTANSGDKSE
jgi:hypothetical protein